MTTTTFDHDAFSAKLATLPSKEAKTEAIKNYLFGLPSEEISHFMFWRLDEAILAIPELEKKGEISQEEKAQLNKSLDDLFETAEAMRSRFKLSAAVAK